MPEKSEYPLPDRVERFKKAYDASRISAGFEFLSDLRIVCFGIPNYGNPAEDSPVSWLVMFNDSDEKLHLDNGEAHKFICDALAQNLVKNGVEVDYWPIPG